MTLFMPLKAGYNPETDRNTRQRFAHIRKLKMYKLSHPEHTALSPFSVCQSPRQCSSTFNPYVCLLNHPIIQLYDSNKKTAQIKSM